LYGKSCRMDKIVSFAKRHGLDVIEDCAQSHGSSLQGSLTGTFGAAGCFSFYPTKNLGGVGDCGAIVTNDSDLADRLLYLRNYGSKIKYVNEYLGSNSRLDEIQAAALRVKLPHLNRIIAHKRLLAGLYFKNLPPQLILPSYSVDEFDTYHIFAVRHERRDELRSWLLERGIKTEIHYPIAPHHQNAMTAILKGSYPIADKIHATELSLPISFGTTSEEVLFICEEIRKFPFLDS
jgi:dTDP-4-amino-4,6-dideoxygalactose transaminase